MTPYHIGVLGFGEVGSLLHDALLANGHQVTIWDIAVNLCDSPVQERLRSRRGVLVAESAEGFAQGCKIVISVVTAGNAMLALESVLPGLAPDTYYLDLNSVAPNTKKLMALRLERTGVRFVEGAVMSPIHPKGVESPTLFAGPHAATFLTMAHTLGFNNSKVCSAELGQASATKMCRSVVIKGLEALLTESMLVARHYGVDSDVLASLTNLLPRDDWPEYAHYMISRSLEHGVRRSEEMREVAKTVSDAGITPLMSEACAERQAWAAQFSDAQDASDLGSSLDRIFQLVTARSQEG